MVELRHCGSVAGSLGALALAVLVLSTSACNTVAGLGQDVQAAGSAVSNTAEDVKDGSN